MLIQNVTSTTTYKLYLQLLELGFNVTLSSMFHYNYDKVNSYLAITVREAENRLNELHSTAKNFEIILVKYAQENEVSLEVRKPHEFGEFVTDPVWREYYDSITVQQ